MISRRRLVALATTVAIAWTALWPLVSSAWFSAGDGPMPLCHMAGMQVSPDQEPDPSAPGEAPKQHCPLCIMVFLAAFTPPVVPPAAPVFENQAGLGHHSAPPPAGVETALPQSRAPPVTA